MVLLTGCSALWGYDVGVGVKARSREVIKQRVSSAKKKKLVLPAAVGVIYGSWRGTFLSSPEVWKYQQSRLRSLWGLCVQASLGIKCSFALRCFINLLFDCRGEQGLEAQM